MTEHPGRLLRFLLLWTTVTTLPFWLIVVRGAFDGPTYRWGLFGFTGAGIGSDYWFPTAGVAFALTMLILGWRGARPPFHWLLMTWHFLLAGVITYGAVTVGEQFRLQGDTLGMSVPLAGGRGLFWRYGRARGVLGVPGSHIRWQTPDGPADQAGVVLTISQWFLLAEAIKPRARASGSS